jgi:heterodisulfide reductase subunit A-like polyferredoxin
MKRRKFVQSTMLSATLSGLVFHGNSRNTGLTSAHSLNEPARSIPVSGEYDVIVCGGGPAGVSAAIQAGRSGAKTLLVESHGCLGGVWTSGLLSWIDLKNYINFNCHMQPLLTKQLFLFIIMII